MAIDIHIDIVIVGVSNTVAVYKRYFSRSALVLLLLSNQQAAAGAYDKIWPFITFTGYTLHRLRLGASIVDTDCSYRPSASTGCAELSNNCWCWLLHWLLAMTVGTDCCHWQMAPTVGIDCQHWFSAHIIGTDRQHQLSAPMVGTNYQHWPSAKTVGTNRQDQLSGNPRWHSRYSRHSWCQLSASILSTDSQHKFSVPTVNTNCQHWLWIQTVALTVDKDCLRKFPVPVVRQTPLAQSALTVITNYQLPANYRSLLRPSKSPDEPNLFLLRDQKRFGHVLTCLL